VRSSAGHTSHKLVLTQCHELARICNAGLYRAMLIGSRLYEPEHEYDAKTIYQIRHKFR